MDRAMAQRHLSFTRHQFDAYFLAGLLPPPREHVPGVIRWHRDELDAAMARAWNLRQVADEAEQAREADAVLAAIATRAARVAAERAGAADRRGRSASAPGPGATGPATIRLRARKP
jgi:hypothetical protein